MSLDAKMITVDCAEPRKLAAWWAEVLDTEIAQDFGGEFVIVGAQPLVLGFQHVPEPRQVKNRVHVDFHTEDRPTEVDRLVELGASVVGEHSAGPLTWTVLRDPEGNEFCVAG
ncbi:VOC family protein [Streptomyces luteolifulvus]|uniref:VOC family protein n=1 Tax=Streptomyces luteolifulvus TaxID=2615112 RepID=A0A6H9V7Q8_9ACTN|nr:VOC family protein [Streptomyces luteolifulvus]KAB1150050.1 VOC family protein [Streptomyces luteolifulvus]